MLSKRSNFFPLVPEILELPCLQTSPSSGRRDTFKYRENAHQPLTPSFVAGNYRERPHSSNSTDSLALAIFSNYFSRDSNSGGRELQGSFLNRPRPFALHLSPALFPAAFALRVCARPSFQLEPDLPVGGACARAPSPCCALVSPWARAGLCVHGTQSRGPSRDDGGDGESRGWPDGRETPYLP